MTRQRLTVQEAAEVLSTSVDAVRMRLRRGSLDSEKDPDGRVYVWVDDDSPEIKPRPRGEPTALIFEMKEHIALLEAGAGQGALRIGRTDASSWPLPAGFPSFRPQETLKSPSGSAPEGRGGRRSTHRRWWVC